MTSYQVLPALTSDELARLTESIREHGVKVPVVKDEAGAIIDGHHRVMIADSLGIDYDTVVVPGLAEHEKRILALSLNVDRRQVTDAQRVLAGEAIEPDYKERARRRQVELAGTRRDTSGAIAPEVLHTPIRARDEIAKAVGIGHGSTYERQRDLINQARAVFGTEAVNDRIASGRTDLKQLSQDVQHQRAAASARLLQNIADPDELAMDQMRVEVARGLKHLGELIRLQPDAVAASLESNRLPGVRMRIKDARQWLDAVESGIEPRGLRVVG